MPPWVVAIPPIVFILAVGACVGSFLNVVAFRLPRGEGLFRPGSRCPHCETPLTWRENFPVFGWVALRGRCRFCRSPVSPEYPMVELGVALIFAGVFAAWFLHSLTGVTPPSAGAPEWTRAGLLAMWPMFTLVLALLAGLVAMTLIDAKTYTIPISITTLLIAMSLIAHPLHAIAAARPGNTASLASFARGWGWTIPTPLSPASLLATLGAGAGLALSCALLWLGALPRSFADFAAWEDRALAQAHADADQSSAPGATPPATSDVSLRATFLRALAFTGPAIALMAAGMLLGRRFEAPMAGMGVGLVVGLVLGTALRATIRDPAPVPTPATSPPNRIEQPAPAATPASTAPQRTSPSVAPSLIAVLLGAAAGWPLGWGIAAVGAGVGLIVAVVLRSTHAAPEVASPAEAGANADPHWLEYPHARREMLKEALFLAPALALGALGFWLAMRDGAAPWEWVQSPPLWLRALSGSILGLLVGGGVVWIVRILGTFGFGKEAMGMGDVHLMAAVGAAAGWIDPLLAFFLAPASGLLYAVGGMIRRGRAAAALPYGPHLALATVFVILWKPWAESLLSLILGRVVDLP